MSPNSFYSKIIVSGTDFQGYHTINVLKKKLKEHMQYVTWEPVDYKN